MSPTPVQAGDETETAIGAARLADDVRLGSALLAIPYWPAWRAVGAAALEIGSRLLVLGGDEFVRNTLLLAWTRGCAWRACLSEEPVACAAEFAVSSASALAALPAHPDAVIVASQAGDSLDVATRACGDRGTVVVAGTAGRPVDLGFYTDVHRRGLKVVFLPPRGTGPAEVAAFARLTRLVDAGRLVVSP